MATVNLILTIKEVLNINHIKTGKPGYQIIYNLNNCHQFSPYLYNDDQFNKWVNQYFASWFTTYYINFEFIDLTNNSYYIDKLKNQLEYLVLKNT